MRTNTAARRAAGLLVLLMLALAACSQPTNNLQSQRDPALPWPLSLPQGFRLTPYATGLGELRSVAFGPNGVPYVTVMARSSRSGGKLLALPDDNGDGKADRTVVVADKLDRPHGLVFHAGELYVSDTGTIWHLRDTNGDLVADERDAVVSDLPTNGDHWSRPFVFDQNGDILVGVGSSCNNCQEGNKRRATILRYPAAILGQPEQKPGTFARGLRSAVGMTWRPGTQELWVTNNGPDHLGRDLPNDQLFQVEDGKHYGWPYCYGDRTPDPQVLANPDVSTPDKTPKDVFCKEDVTAPELLLPPHSAPLNLAFYDGTQFPAEMRGNLFIALHGSYDGSVRDGYKVVRVPFVDGKPGTPQDFLAGFMEPGDTRWRGRPVGMAVAPDGSLFVTDDANGNLYRIEYVGTKTASGS